jgi:hypothetical protein
MEILLEAVGLQQIGQLESADIAAAFPNLPLQINNHSSHLRQREALMQ